MHPSSRAFWARRIAPVYLSPKEWEELPVYPAQHQAAPLPLGDRLWTAQPLWKRADLLSYCPNTWIVGCLINGPVPYGLVEWRRPVIRLTSADYTRCLQEAA